MIGWIVRRVGPGRRRAAVRCALLAVAAVLALPSGGRPWLARALPALSPLTALGAALTLRGAGVVMVLAVPAAALALWRRRWFCRWVCPAGCAQDLACGRVRRGAHGAWWLRWPRVGEWIAALALGAAAVGAPALLWLDPLAIFSGFFNGVRPGASVMERVAAVGLPALLILSFAAPKAWCLRVCPLGGLQDLLAGVKDRFWKRGLRREGGRGQGRGVEAGDALGRRVVLGAGVGAVWAGMTRSASGREKTGPLRPPGARDEALFSGLCLRCGACLRVCPSRILKPFSGGFIGLFTPEARFERDYCREGCRACMEACPSGALARLTSEAKWRYKIGVARVDAERCLMAQGRECTSCLNRCPYGALDTMWDAENMVSLPAVDGTKCNGCGACQAACVAEPERAIRVGR